MKSEFLRKDPISALAYLLVFSLLAFGVFGDGFQSLERGLYDAGVRGRSVVPSDRVAVVAIDEQSIANKGRWPWSRTVQAQLLDAITAGGPKVVVNTALYIEPESNATADAAAGVAQALAASPLVSQIPVEIETFGVMLGDAAKNTPSLKPIAQAYLQSSLATKYTSSVNALVAQINALITSTATPDTVLAASMARNEHVVLPLVVGLGETLGAEDPAYAELLARISLPNVVDSHGAKASGALPLPAATISAPVATLSAKAAGLGHLNAYPDPVDGVVRQEPLVVNYYGHFIPSLALQATTLALNLKPSDITLRLGEGVFAAGLKLPTNSALLLSTQFYKGRNGASAFAPDSAFDVMAGKIPAEKYKDKIVLIGTTATGTGDVFATPLSASMPPVILMAHTVSSLLQQHYFTRPAWGWMAEAALMLLLAGYLAAVVPRLSAGLAAGVTAGLVIGLLAAEYLMLTNSALWLKLVVPAIFVGTGYGFMLLKRFNFMEKLKSASESESAESNRMLGLAFQGQNQLDMAFEKFKRVKPVDDRLLDLLYNLALDFERKRQFNKAESVYQYILGESPNFKDVGVKMARAKKMSDTTILGGMGNNTTAGGTLIMMGGEGSEKPMLGRYQVEKELGKGAMGVVYLGKDPKIGRMVAIKTMALSQEFEADELKDVKERFFREAETAGRLSHPNIVSIYDAGEEHDLAYIAMELIQGHDLTKHIKPDTLLPPADVIQIIARAAQALDYAHLNNVVHRDIKPANMMLVAATNSLKLMDFGIARIAGSSKTKTGMVLGTPSYMSPEQLSGKKVDGRSDLFSLGVTLYQMLTGQLPFHADSMASLMFKIANEAHGSVLALNPALPPAIEPIITKVLQKDFELRYQRGTELADDLLALLKN